jgi:hypothetical protein
MANCYFAKPQGMQHCYIPFFMLLISNALLVLARHSLRVSHLREVGCNESILKAWLGHSAGSDVTNKYDKSADNLAARKTWAERCGTGLDLSDTTTEPPAPRIGKDPQAEIVVKHSLVRRKPQSVIAEEVVAVEYHYVASDDDLPEIFSTPVAEEV